MKEEMSIDELLNSFVDGELTTQQEDEVRHQIENDPQIAQRVQQLQKCKLLMNSLPIAEAPSGMLDDIKASMESRSQQDRPFISQQRKETISLLPRRMAAVAAMIGFVAVLTAVVFTIAPPEGTHEGIGNVPGTSVAAATGFSGILEFKTKELNAVDSFITRTIENNGYTDFLNPTQDAGKRIYTINCSKEDLTRLLTDLDNIWDKLDSTNLNINTDVFGEHVVVNAVTTKQIAEIVNQNSSSRSIEVAKDFSAFNGIAGQLPGRDIFSAIEDRTTILMKNGVPYLTEKIIEKPEIRENGEKTINLTIVLSK